MGSSQYRVRDAIVPFFMAAALTVMGFFATYNWKTVSVVSLAIWFPDSALLHLLGAASVALLWSSIHYFLLAAVWIVMTRRPLVAMATVVGIHAVLVAIALPLALNAVQP